jgi:hypothetical protein
MLSASPRIGRAAILRCSIMHADGSAGGRAAILKGLHRRLSSRAALRLPRRKTHAIGKAPSTANKARGGNISAPALRWRSPSSEMVVLPQAVDASRVLVEGCRAGLVAGCIHEGRHGNTCGAPPGVDTGGREGRVGLCLGRHRHGAAATQSTVTVHCAALMGARYPECGTGPRYMGPPYPLVLAVHGGLYGVTLPCCSGGPCRSRAAAPP